MKFSKDTVIDGMITSASQLKKGMAVYHVYGVSQTFNPEKETLVTDVLTYPEWKKLNNEQYKPGTLSLDCSKWIEVEYFSSYVKKTVRTARSLGDCGIDSESEGGPYNYNRLFTSEESARQYWQMCQDAKIPESYYYLNYDCTD